MKRLTSNKPVSDMSMVELAHNSCYADVDRNARYRDYEVDVNAREMAKKIAKDMAGLDFNGISDEDFDECIFEELSDGTDSLIGLIALFYRNLWVTADLRERLKYYEDLEEQGRLLKLPCKEIYLSSGDCVYLIYDYEIVECVHCGVDLCADGKLWINLACNEDIFPFRSPDPEHDLDPTDWCTNTTCVEVSEWAKSIFLTKSEAKEKLKELRDEENES